MIRRKPTIAFIGLMAFSLVSATNCAKKTVDKQASETEFPGENERAVAALRADNALLHRKMRVLEEELRLRQAGQSKLSQPEQTNADLSPGVESSTRNMEGSSSGEDSLASSRSASRESTKPPSKRPTRSSKSISLAPLPHSSPEGLDRYWRDSSVQTNAPQEASSLDVLENETFVSDDSHLESDSTKSVRKFRIVGSRVREVTPKKRSKSRPKTQNKSKVSSRARTNQVKHQAASSSYQNREISKDGRSKREKLDQVKSRSRSRAPKKLVRESVETAYANAMQKYKNGEFREAERAFAAIVKKYPRHAYADNAMYWQGESVYDQGQFSDAITIFTQVVEQYSSGNKVADALLKIALCYRRLGDLTNARDVLKQLVSMFPNSEAGAIAQERLSNRRKAKI